MQPEPLNASLTENNKMSAVLGTKHDSDEGTVSPATPSETASVNERSLLRKIDGRLLPAVGVLYLLSFLDRSNGNNSSSW